MDDIRNWLNSKRDYNEGVQLFLKYNDDELLTRLFTQEGYSEYKFKRLVSSLEGMISRKPADKPPKRQEPVAEQTKPINKWNKKRDEVEESLFLQWRQKYNDMIRLQALVGDLSKIATRNKDKSKMDEAGRMALKILELDDDCDGIFWRRDFYKENRRLPEDDTPIKIAVDPSLWYKKLHNHQRYVRQFKKRLEKDLGDVDAAALLKKHEWAASEYKKLLKMDDEN